MGLRHGVGNHRFDDLGLDTGEARGSLVFALYVSYGGEGGVYVFLGECVFLSGGMLVYDVMVMEKGNLLGRRRLREGEAGKGANRNPSASFRESLHGIQA